jgi:hypothetical protein
MNSSMQHERERTFLAQRNLPMADPELVLVQGRTPYGEAGIRDDRQVDSYFSFVTKAYLYM